MVHRDSFGIVISDLSVVRFLLQKYFNLCRILLPVLVNHGLNRFLVLTELYPIDVIDNRLPLELLQLLPKYLGQEMLLKTFELSFEYAEHTFGRVKLVNELVAFFKKPCVNDRLEISANHCQPLFQCFYLHVLRVEQFPVRLLHLVLGVCP